MMLGFSVALAVLSSTARASEPVAKAHELLQHSLARGRPLVGLHQAIQRQATEYKLEGYVTRTDKAVPDMRS